MKTFSKHALSPSSAKRARGRIEKKKFRPFYHPPPPFFSRPSNIPTLSFFTKYVPLCVSVRTYCTSARACPSPRVAGSSRTAQLQSVLPLLFTLDYPNASKHFTSAPFTGVRMWLCVRAHLCVHAHMRVHTL